MGQAEACGFQLLPAGQLAQELFRGALGRGGVAGGSLGGGGEVGGLAGLGGVEGFGDFGLDVGVVLAEEGEAGVGVGELPDGVAQARALV